MPLSTRRSVIPSALAIMVALATAALLSVGTAMAAPPGTANAPPMAGDMMPGHAPPAMSLPDARDLVHLPLIAFAERHSGTGTG